MKRNKLGALALSVLMAGTMLAGCGTVSPSGSSSASSAAASSAAASSAAESASSSETAEEAASSASSEEVASVSAPAQVTLDKPVTIGINQLVQHPALDAATKGFEDELKAVLGDQVTFDEQNAAGDAATAQTIAGNLAAEKVDLILANATASLQACASATSDIPILGTSITDYGVALELENYDGTVGGNISGTSDLAPLDQQAALFDELLPDAKTIGILYCSAEPNSKYQADTVQKALEDAGKTVKAYTFSDSNDVQAVTTSAVSECDALYIPTDNTAASCAETINNVAEPAGKPIIAGEEGIMAGCGIATLSIDYYELGKVTGDMAVKILTGEADISTMPIEYYPNPKKEYDKERCEKLGITVPDDFEAYVAEE
ncbi:MAG: ABC transporter substrate-binding protein [Eubacterium sp.]|nr:ABC transporter substrate-binding protein [Eubacterium sp.]